MRQRWRRLVRSRRDRGEGHTLLLSLFLGIGLAVVLIHQINAALHPQLAALAEAQTRNLITHISEQAVAKALDDLGIFDGDMVTMTSDGAAATTFSTNIHQLNTLRGVVVEEIVSQVETLDSHDLGVPLGAVFRLDILSALGPRLPVRVLSVASASGEFHNEFAEAGINQTLHRIMLDVSVTVRLLLPSGMETVEIATPVCVTETIFVGQVPQSYLNVNQ